MGAIHFRETFVSKDEPEGAVEKSRAMEKQLTPSPSTNALIELAEQVTQKQAQLEPLEQLLNQRLETVLASREDFERRAEAMGEAFTIPTSELIDQVHDYFDAYEDTVRSMLSYREKESAKLLLDGNARLVELTEPMMHTVQAYSRAFMTFGPSPYPLVNAVTNILRNMLEGTANQQTLDLIVNEAVEQNAAAVAEIDGSPAGRSEGWQKKRAAFERVSAAAKAVKPVASTEEIEGATALLKEAFEAISQADELIFSENMAQEPTPMPAANVLINTARGVLSGIYSAEVMEETLAWYQGYMSAVEEQFNMAVEGETDSVLLLDELPRTREIADLHSEVIEDLTDALGDFNADSVEPILEELIEVVGRLHDSSKVYMEVAAREGKVVCVACGEPNPPTDRSCQKCGQKLPQLVDPNLYATSTIEFEDRSGLGIEERPDGVVTENTYKLFEACAKFFEQKITEAEYRATLEWSRGLLQAAEEKVRAAKAAEVSDDVFATATPDEVELIEANLKLFADTKHLFEEGIEEWHEGLELMEDYIETRHRPTIEQGIERIWSASQKVYQIHEIGEIAQKVLDERDRQEQVEAQNTGLPISSYGEGAIPEDDSPPEFEQKEYVQGEGGLA